MGICSTCQNNYNKTFDIIINAKTYTFDCFECAITKLVPHCKQCDCIIIGHGIEAHEHYYCCAHCAKQQGYSKACDHR
ncbi:MAG: hypothetical protein LEGION0398_MBIBDBAK_00982 [Legionellaceae bacterium]